MYEVIIKNDGKEEILHSPNPSNEAPKVIGGTIKQGINCIDTFTFSILPNNKSYNSLNPYKTLVDVINTKENRLEFRGRVLIPNEITATSGSTYKSVICESELAYLRDSTQWWREFHNIGVAEFLGEIIAHHNRQVEPHKQFHVGIVTVKDNNDSLYRFVDYVDTFDTITDKLIDRLGGEIRIRYEDGKKYLDYCESFGDFKETEIRLTKNLQTIERERDPSEIITRGIILGRKNENNDGRLTIVNVNPTGRGFIDDTQALEEFGVIERAIIFDDVTDEKILIKKGREYMQKNNKLKKKHKISALDLSLINLDVNSFQVYNTHQVVNPLMGIDEPLRIIEKTITFDNPQNSNLIIGDKFEDIKEYQKNVKKTEKAVNAVKENLSLSVDALGNVNSELSNTVDVVGGIAEIVTVTTEVVDTLYNNEVVNFERVDNKLVITKRSGEVVEIDLTPTTTETAPESIAMMMLGEEVKPNYIEESESIPPLKSMIETIKENIANISLKLERVKKIMKG